MKIQVINSFINKINFKELVENTEPFNTPYENEMTDLSKNYSNKYLEIKKSYSDSEIDSVEFLEKKNNLDLWLENSKKNIEHKFLAPFKK